MTWHGCGSFRLAYTQDELDWLQHTLSVGKVLSITAGDQISITTGSASIVMKKDGTITIKGKDITIQGSGKINAKASKNVVIKGQKILQN